MAERGGLMRFENVRVQVRNSPAAHGLQKVGEMTFVAARESADQLAVQVEERRVRDNSFGALKNPLALEVRMERQRLQSTRLGHDCLATKIENDDLRVGCLGSVRVTEA